MQPQPLQVEIVGTFLSQFLLPLLIVFIASTFVSLALYFSLKKQRQKDSLLIEKKKIEIQIRGDFVKRAIKLIDGLEKILRDAYTVFLHLEMSKNLNQFDGCSKISEYIDSMGYFFNPYSEKIHKNFVAKQLNLDHYIEKTIINVYNNWKKDDDIYCIEESMYDVSQLCNELKDMLFDYLYAL